MVEKFEVGKKYKTEYSAVCKFIGYASDNRRVWEKTTNNQIFDESTLGDLWREYKEPKVHTRHLYWMKNPKGNIACALLEREMTEQERYLNASKAFGEYIEVKHVVETYIED